jgi:hypothetical protein
MPLEGAGEAETEPWDEEDEDAVGGRRLLFFVDLPFRR